MSEDEVIIRYKINKNENMKIFGTKFVKTNKKICKIKINGKEEELTEAYNTNTLRQLPTYIYLFKENEILEIRLIGISKVTDMSKMFYDCQLLHSLPDINIWDTSNAIDMNYLFYDCKSVIDLSAISHWNLSK